MVSTALSTQAYEHIQRQILSGQLPAGAVLSEHSLARQIGISRTPVREAIQQLEREGLLEQVPRYGTIVRRPERRDIVELYELREAMECFAVRRAAETVTEADLGMLQKLCGEIAELAQRMEQAGDTVLDAAGMKRFLAADMAFHMVLIRAAGNRRIVKAVAESRVLARIFGTPRQEHDLSVVREAGRYHEAIRKAVAKRDVEGAEKLMREHIRASLAQTLQHFDRAAAGAQTLDLPADLLTEFSDIEHGKPPKARPTAPRRKTARKTA